MTQTEKSFHYTEVIITGHELLPDKEDIDGEELLLALLNKNFGFQRSSNMGELRIKSNIIYSIF